MLENKISSITEENSCKTRSSCKIQRDYSKRKPVQISTFKFSEFVQVVEDSYAKLITQLFGDRMAHILNATGCCFNLG